MPRLTEVVRKVKVEDLSLDLSNFRFAVDQPDETLAFNYLFDEEDVMSVARSLLREGYRTNEVPLVVEEDDRYVVLEANRRVSALRALRDPSLVPNHREQLTRLVRRHQTDADDLPDDIYVSIYPNRAAAAPVLARQHIGEDKKRWGLDEQAKFVLAQLAGGADVRTLRATLTGIKDVVRLIRMGRVRQALKDTAFVDPDLARYAVGADLKMSAFEYAYRDRSIRPLLGFEFDDEGNVTSRPETPGQVAVLERLLRGFRSGELNTRKVLNDKKGEAYARLLEELRAAAGEPLSTETPAAPPQSDDSPTASRPSIAETEPRSGEPRVGPAPNSTQRIALPSNSNPVGPNNPDTRRRLLVTSVDYSEMPVGLQKRFIELRSIDIENYPAAAAMLLRSIMESLIKQHYLARGDRSVSGMLGDVVPRLARDYGSVASLKRAIQLLQNALSPRERPGSGLWFNSVSHDPAVAIDAQQVRSAWQELQPLVSFLLQPPVASS